MVYYIAAVVLLLWVVFIALAVRQVLKKPVCPECKSERIRSVGIHTALITRNGQRIPAAWMYRRCEACGTRLKWDVGLDKWVHLTPGEWEEVVKNAEEIP